MGKIQRFGLFSQPISNAIGDTTYFREKKADLDEDGAVKTAPRNFTTFKTIKGRGPDIYFQKGDE